MSYSRKQQMATVIAAKSFHVRFVPLPFMARWAGATEPQTAEVELWPSLLLRFRLDHSGDRGSDDFARNDQLHAAILLAAGCRIVGCHWPALAESMSADGRPDDSLADQKIANRGRSIFGQAEVPIPRCRYDLPPQR
jgi:hypothetical protein